jgi:hypothetical protein
LSPKKEKKAKGEGDKAKGAVQLMKKVLSEDGKVLLTGSRRPSFTLFSLPFLLQPFPLSPVLGIGATHPAFFSLPAKGE